MMFELNPRSDGWVEIFNFQVPTGYQGKKQALKEFREIEGKIIEDGWFGWITWAKIEDYEMIKVIDHLGGTEYHCDGTDIFFYKELDHVRHTKEQGTDSEPQRSEPGHGETGESGDPGIVEDEKCETKPRRKPRRRKRKPRSNDDATGDATTSSA